MDIIKTTLLGLFFGTFGTTLGGIIVSIGLAIHNFPEGLAIGSGLLLFTAVKAGSKFRINGFRQLEGLDSFVFIVFSAQYMI